MKHFHKQSKLLGLLIAAGILWSALTLLSDSKAVLHSAGLISIKRMLLVFLLSGANYWVRVLRFQWFTSRVAKQPIKKDMNAIIFFSGLSMNLTPARIGELVKAYFQHRFFGESFARMAPIVFFERLADGLAMLLLMSVGVRSLQLGKELFFTLVLLALSVIAVLHWRPLGIKLVMLLGKLPFGNLVAAPLERALFSSFELSEGKSLIVGTLLGLVAWILEASGLWFLIGAIGVPMTLENFYLVLFIFSISAAVGFLSIIPGGIGVNELSTIGLLEKLMGVHYADALVVTFAFRLVTLWFGVILGITSVVYLKRRLIP